MFKNKKYQIKSGGISNEKSPYFGSLSLCTGTEKHVFHNLLSILDSSNYIVCPQVSLLAIVKVKYLSFLYRKYFFNRIGKKYIDFLIIDRLTTKPLLVVEVNGVSHKQAKREKKR